MTSILLALALGQTLNLNDTPVRQGRGFDGGVTWGIWCVNCSGGGGSGGTVTQGVGYDGGGFWNVRSVLFNSSNAEVGTLLNPLQVNATPLEADSFSAAVVATRYNQVEIDYSTAAPSTITDITITTSGGGSSSSSGGQAVFSTSTGATGSVKAVTNTTVSYRPQAEVYAAFTAIFTTGTAGSIQRLGIYDTSNGFFLGFEGTSFGLTLRKAGVDTRTAQASFNLDTLTGAAGSKYTRAGVPEAMDPTKDQLYRIRFGWLGAAPIIWEILSPDGKWVPFHIIRHPNTVAATTINSPNLPITLEATKTSGATNITISTACWAAGTTSNLIKVTDTITENTLATMSRSVITGQTTAGGGGFVNVKVAPSGALATSATVDNTQTISGYTPNPSSVYAAGGGVFTFDPSGNLAVRGQTTTDEGAFSDGFEYLAAATSGTATFTTGSATVTGSGTSFTTQLNTDKYVRLSTDPLGSGKRIASIESDTSLTLEANYTATGGSGTLVASNWTSVIPDGGVATVDGGSFTVTNSGVANDVIAVYRSLDYGPIDLTFRLAVSARNSTETIEVGLHNDIPPNDSIHAAFEFTGVDATAATCKTSFSGAGASNSIGFTMPGGGSTSTQHLYTVSLLQDRAAFYVDGVQVCTSQYNLPAPYQPLLFGLYITENSATASPASVTGTWAQSSSYNRMDAIVQNAVPAKLQAQVQGPNAAGSPVTSNPLVMGGSDGVGLRVLNVSPQGEPIVIGSLGNDSNAPANDNVGALTAVATSAAPTYNAGNLVALSVDLGGKLRTTASQGAGADGGTGWGVWIEGGSLAVSSSTSFDGGNIGYMLMPDGGPLEVALTSGTISIATVGQGAGQDGGAWNVSVNNFPATQAVSGTVSISGTTSNNLAQVNGSTVTTGSGASAAGTQRVILATDQPVIPVGDNGGSLTVDGTVAASQSGTWSTRTQDGSGNNVESAVAPVNGTNRGLVLRSVMKTATNPLATGVSCATTATALPATALTNRQSLCVYNNGTNTIFLGPSGVTTTNGFPLARGASYCDDVGSQVLYCIVSAGTENARVLEQ